MVITHLQSQRCFQNTRLDRFGVQNPYKSLLQVDFSTASDKHISFSYEKFSLQLNHYLKNDFDENPRRFFIAGLFRERGSQQYDRGEL